LLTMSTASSNNDILSEAMQALDDNVSAPQTPANEDNAARDPQIQAQAPPQPLMQLDKLPLESFSGDITQFHSFWSAFELAVHNNFSIPSVYKFPYLRGLLKGDARIVLQDLDPDECSYADLVQALKRRYDRPHRTRARLHMQLKQLPRSGPLGSELRETWFRISGILHGLRKFEGFKMKGEDFDLDAVMRHLDNIIASKEKYEDSTILNEDYAVNEKTPRGQPVVKPASTDTSAQFRTARQAEDITPAPLTSRLHSDTEDALALQFVRILQKNPAADIPLIKQLTDELSQLTAVKEHPEVEIYIAVSAVTPRRKFTFRNVENIMTIQSLIYNITARQAAIHNQFTPQAFRQDDQPRLADQLAQYGIHFSDVHDTLALATATVAEAQQVLSDLLQQHFERLLTIQDDEVFAATGQVQLQARSSGAGTKRQMQSPTFSEEIDKLVRKASLRPTPQPIGDIPMDEPQQVAHVAQLGQGLVAYQQFPLAVAAEEEVPAQVAAPVVVPAQVAAQPTASMQAATAPSAPIQPVRIPLERAVSSGTAELAQDPRFIYRHNDFTPPRYQYPLQPQFQEEQEHVVPSCFFCHGYHYSSGCHVVVNLSARLYIHAQRGRCFKCGEEHDERNCRLRRKCRACQSLRHHTAFCKYNNHVRVDFPEHEFYDRLEAAMADTREVRMRRRRAQFQNY
uniref:Retrovirus-related Pol polyprotein from transposon TNT 1-94 n=1 Tax=Heligmosomoides polygyrus TaxID=6339 RepID=A0A183GRJ5_HELPZ